MRAFRCPDCGGAVAFDVQQVPTCATTVGYHHPSRQMLAAPSETITGDGRGWVRCAHWARGCNWLSEDDAASGCNRINNSMGRDDLYPFTIYPHVVATLGFIHRVVVQRN